MTQLELTALAHNSRRAGRGLVTPTERNSLLTGLSYPSAPGFKEKGGTSEAAARAIVGRCELLRIKCLEALHKKNMTSVELADALGESVVSVRPRVSELARQHKIFRSKERRKYRSHSRSIVWTLFAEEAMPVGCDELGLRCLEALREQDMTADELAMALGESILIVRPRVSLLLAQRQVFKTGKRRKNASGCSAVVWAVCTAATNGDVQTGAVAGGSATCDQPCREARENTP